MVFCSSKLRMAMPSASMPHTPRGALAVMRQGPCEQSEQRMPCSQKPQRLPCASMRSKTVSSPSAWTLSYMSTTEVWQLIMLASMGSSVRLWGQAKKGGAPSEGAAYPLLGRRHPWMSAGRHLTHTQVLSPWVRTGSSGASISLRPQFMQVWVMVCVGGELGGHLLGRGLSSNSGASRFSTVSAPSGQTARQKPAPSQSCSFTTFALPSTISMAPSAHGVTHRPQPVQSSSSI